MAERPIVRFADARSTRPTPSRPALRTGALRRPNPRNAARAARRREARPGGLTAAAVGAAAMAIVASVAGFDVAIALFGAGSAPGPVATYAGLGLAAPLALFALLALAARRRNALDARPSADGA